MTVSGSPGELLKQTDERGGSGSVEFVQLQLLVEQVEDVEKCRNVREQRSGTVQLKRRAGG